MKKKVVIVNNNAQLGGVQKSLVNLLQEIKDEYDITLFLFKKEGEYLKDIPECVKIVEGNKLLQILGTSQRKSIDIGKFYYLVRAVFVIWNKLFGNRLTYKILMKSQKGIGEFDYAISYLQSSHEKRFYGGCNEFVLQNIKAKEKITFIHCDFISYGGNTKYNRNIYRKFDKIAAVSQNCKNRFIIAMPELDGKVYSVRNFNNYEDIEAKSNIDTVIYPKDYINIVTVSRLAEEKGIGRSLNVIKDLINSGMKIKWHIVGDGILKSEIESLIKEEKLNDNIILYGATQNPYRYMKNADLFLLTSYHEAAPMVFDEAKYLGIPIFATRTTSTSEIIEQDSAGWVCNNDDESIRESLIQILKNRKEIESVKKELQNKKYNNENSLLAFKELIK